MTPAATPGPHPWPHQYADASVVVTATVSPIVALMSKLVSVLFIGLSLNVCKPFLLTRGDEQRRHLSFTYDENFFY
jgi:hypothetical protein